MSNDALSSLLETKASKTLKPIIMTTYYWKSASWSNKSTDQNPTQSEIDLWENLTRKKNWRITELYNGYFQTEFYNTSVDFGGKEDQWVPITRRQTIEDAEAAIDESISHYKKRIELSKGPKVVKTFK